MDFKKMKKYIIPAITVFVVITAYDMVFHGVLMEDLYNQNASLFRPQEFMCKNKYLFWLANFIYSFAFCYIYAKGHEKTDPIQQGLRFGIWVTLLVWIPQTIVSYLVYPHPANLELAWLGGATVQSLLAGVTAATVFSKKK